MTLCIRQLQLLSPADADARSTNGLVQVGKPVIAGGSMISNAAAQAPNVFARVFVSGTSPKGCESTADVTNRFNGSTLGDKLTRCRSPTATRTSI